MFDGLKKKFSEFVDTLSRKEKEKAEEQEKVQETATEPEKKEEAPVAEEEELPEVTEQKHEPQKPKEPEPAPEKYEPVHVHPEEKHVERRKGPDVTLMTKLKGTILGEVKISEKDIDPFLDNLRLALLQTDVNYDVADRIVDTLHTNLVGKTISSKGIAKGISDELRNSIIGIMSKNVGVDIIKIAQEKKAK